MCYQIHIIQVIAFIASIACVEFCFHMMFAQSAQKTVEHTPTDDYIDVVEYTVIKE